MSEDRMRTGIASSTRRRTYLYTATLECADGFAGGALVGGLGGARSPSWSFIEPGSRDRRRSVPVGAPEGAGRRVPHVRLEQEEAVVVRHPHPEHLVVLAIDDLLRQRTLPGLIWRLPQLGGEVVEHRIVDPEEVLRRFRMQVVVRPLVQPDRVARLEAPRHAVPLPLDVAPVIGRVVELGDLDVDVEVLPEILLDELHLRAHLREILVVEEGRLEALAVSGFRHQLLRLGGLVLPVRPEILRRRPRVLPVDLRYAPAEDAVTLVDRVHLLLTVDGHRDGAPYP